MTKLVIDGIQTERFNQVDGTTNYAVNGLYSNDVEKLMLNLCNDYNHVDISNENGLLVNLNYMDNKYYGYIKCRG